MFSWKIIPNENQFILTVLYSILYSIIQYIIQYYTVYSEVEFSIYYYALTKTLNKIPCCKKLIYILYLYYDERMDIWWNIAWGKSRGRSQRDFPRPRLRLSPYIPTQVIIQILSISKSDTFSIPVLSSQVGHYWKSLFSILLWQLGLSFQYSPSSAQVDEYCISNRTRGGKYGKIWPEPKGNPEGSGHILSPDTDISPFLIMIYWVFFFNFKCSSISAS